MPRVIEEIIPAGEQQDDGTNVDQEQLHDDPTNIDEDGDAGDVGDGEDGDSGDVGDDEPTLVFDGATLAPDGEDEGGDGKTPTPTWVKELRQVNREQARRIRELENAQTTQQAPQRTVIGDKPKLEDFDYEPEKYEAALTEWFERKRKADEEDASARREQEAQQQAWNATLADHESKLKALPFKDTQAASAAADAALSVVQRGIIVQGAENSGLVKYALGKNPKLLDEFASLKDPVKFAFAVAKLETKLKIAGKRPGTKPEGTIADRGRAPRVQGGSGDKQLERLRAEAERTGDMTKVVAYRREQKNRQRGGT